MFKLMFGEGPAAVIPPVVEVADDQRGQVGPRRNRACRIRWLTCHHALSRRPRCQLARQQAFGRVDDGGGPPGCATESQRDVVVRPHRPPRQDQVAVSSGAVVDVHLKAWSPALKFRQEPRLVMVVGAAGVPRHFCKQIKSGSLLRSPRRSGQSYRRSRRRFFECCSWYSWTSVWVIARRSLTADRRYSMPRLTESAQGIGEATFAPGPAFGFCTLDNRSLS